MKQRQRNSKYAVVILLAIVIAGVVIGANWKTFTAGGSTTEVPETETPVTEVPPTEPTSPPTERPQVLAVVTEITACYSSEPKFQLSVSEHVDVGIFEKSENSDLVQVQLNEKVDCWMPLSSLELNGRNLNAVPIALFVPTLPATEVTSATEPPTAPSTPPSPLALSWKMKSYDCGNRGQATGATIELTVEGGVPKYSFSPNVPIYAIPGQRLTITVSSNTEDGEPARIIDFTVPEANNKDVFACPKAGNNEVKDDISGDEVCYDKKGNKVPCDPDRDPGKN